MNGVCFDEAYEKVKLLADEFYANKAHFLSAAYQESEVRKDFIDKFLIAFGWDVNHEEQKNPFEQEVKVERSVAVQGTQRRADYAFYIKPNFRDVRFFVEAKKPFGDIATAQNYFQTIRYGWNADTPIAVLTDFEQFHILDCRYKPNIDSVLPHGIRNFHYSEYKNKETFAFIYHLFSRECVASGSLENFVKTLTKKRGKAVQRALFKGGYQSIDEAFLKELDNIRETLARVFKTHNPQLDSETLTELTQRTIDRLVFMRFIEDKLIHPEVLVAKFGSNGKAWFDFIAASRKLDGIYNGIVFKRHDILDATSFEVDDDAFGDICEDLSDINSPYDFNSIPIHILGSIYERFLGKVIVTTEKRAHLEEKPEVRKAGGVYYTPEYIVRHIITNSVGKLIDGKTPTQIANLRFADIACGSGSFLLGIYDFLLRYHVSWYNQFPDKADKAGCVLREDGAWHLSLRQRRMILLNNIYGVDVDHQAVEVAQLSLYLKLLQEENTASARQHQLEFHETLLPPLNRNIVCGNSIVSTDIGTGQIVTPIDDRRLNPMDFEQRFPDIMKSGGFDAVVGNPPYLLMQPQNVAEVELSYYRRHFRVAEYKMDIFHLFIQRALQLTKNKGFIGYITPASFLTNNGTVKLRTEILNTAKIEEMIVLPDGVFEEASVDNVVFILQREGNEASRRRNVFPFILAKAAKDEFLRRETLKARQGDFHENVNFIFRPYRTEGFSEVVKKISRFSIKLGDIARVNFGMQLRDRKAYPTDVLVNPANNEITPLHRKCLGGSDVNVYHTGYSGLYCLFDPKAQCGGCWDEEIQFARRKVLVRQIGKTPIASLELEGLCFLNAMFMIRPATDAYDEAFLLGLINSKLLQVYWSNRYYDFKDTFPKIKGTYLQELPIRKPDRITKANQPTIVSFVEQMVLAKKSLFAANTDKDREFYQNKCSAIARHIDAAVYKLYELTPEEVDIVEAGARDI